MKYWVLIMGMTLVTYIPRLIPLVFSSKRPLPEYWKRFLACIPYATLGALIIPEVWSALPGNPWTAMLGLGAAGICAWFGGGLIWPVFTAIAVVYLMLAL